MNVDKNWFETIKHKEDLYVIREKLSEIDPRFQSEYTNLFLLLDTKAALLIDTGAGLYPLKPLIDDLIGNRELLVINTHCHWDHVRSNHDVEEIHIHEIEKQSILRPTNITNLRDSSKDIVKRYEQCDFSLPPASSVKSIKEGDRIDL